MYDRRVICHELGSGLSKDGRDGRTFRIVGRVVSFAVDVLDNIVGTLFAYAGTGSVWAGCGGVVICPDVADSRLIAS
jgi:hypothetical protein